MQFDMIFIWHGCIRSLAVRGLSGIEIRHSPSSFVRATILPSESHCSIHSTRENIHQHVYVLLAIVTVMHDLLFHYLKVHNAVIQLNLERKRNFPLASGEN